MGSAVGGTMGSTRQYSAVLWGVFYYKSCLPYFYLLFLLLFRIFVENHFKNQIVMSKITCSKSCEYISPRLVKICVICEAGFSISNDDLTEENWGWDE